MQEQLEPDEKKPWRVTDIHSASWASERIREAQQALDRIRADAKQERERVDAFEESASREWVERIEFFQTQIKLWAENHMLEYTKKRSLDLPSGMRIGFRGGSPAVNIEDETALIEEIRQYRIEGAIKSTENVVKAVVKKHLQAGIQFINASLSAPVDAFYVKDGDE